MKAYYISIAILLSISPVFAQRTIRDKHITNQQERMVHKQWDKKKFTPTSGFLGLNPEYWLTWALHPDYPKKDLRPLAPTGPQTQRLAFIAAMQNTNNAFKLHADTLNNTASEEVINYSPNFATLDPLWVLYYQHEFQPLLQQDDENLLTNIPINEREYLIRTGVYDWYLEESMLIRQRLDVARNLILDRGSRILAYHRFLLEYRKLNTSWEAKKIYARKFLFLSESTNKIKIRGQPIIKSEGNRTDQQIGDDILTKSKL